MTKLKAKELFLNFFFKEQFDTSKTDEMFSMQPFAILRCLVTGYRGKQRNFGKLLFSKEVYKNYL